MSLTQEQLEQRRKGIGASEVPFIMGLSTFKSPLEVYLDKTRPELLPPDEGDERTKWGHRHEATIADAYLERFPNAIMTTSLTVAHPEFPWALATPDRFVRELAPGTPEDRLLEIKTRDWSTADGFGAPGTDQVPDDVMAQVQWQLFVTGLKRCDVAVLIGGNDFRIYTVYRDEELLAFILLRVREFWFGHVLVGIEPPVVASDVELIGKLFPVAIDASRDPVTDDDRDMLEHFVAAHLVFKGAEKELELRKAQVKQFLGERSAVVYPAAGLSITWKNNRDSVTTDWQALALSYSPDAVTIAQFTTVKPGPRVLRPTVKEIAK